MKELIDGMVMAGYCVSPNNIHAVDGVLMYASGPGVMEPENVMDEIQVHADGIRVFKARFVLTDPANGRGTFVLVPRVDVKTVEEFKVWIALHGKVSTGGVYLDQGVCD